MAHEFKLGSGRERLVDVETGSGRYWFVDFLVDINISLHTSLTPFIPSDLTRQMAPVKSLIVLIQLRLIDSNTDPHFFLLINPLGTPRQHF